LLKNRYFVCSICKKKKIKTSNCQQVCTDKKCKSLQRDSYNKCHESSAENMIDPYIQKKLDEPMIKCFCRLCKQSFMGYKYQYYHEACRVIINRQYEVNVYRVAKF